jgi:glycosyltransferase involved in cell wall biosynthesis
MIEIVTEHRRPRVSVVLPVYDGARVVGRAIRSILEQTFSDFELLTINDGSRDDTRDVVRSFDDPRVRLVDMEHVGLVGALNRGIGEARGIYVARMDADDVALPSRFAKQVAFLDANPSVAVVGTAERIVYGDRAERVRRRPADTQSIRRNIVRVCPFTHSSVMIRRAVFDHVGVYDPAKDGSRRLLVEDYDLWVRILVAGYDLANLPEVLMVSHRGTGSVLRARSMRHRLAQQVQSRLEIIRTLRLGYTAYLDLAAVIVLSVLGQSGVKLDWAFNMLTRAFASTVRTPDGAVVLARRRTGHE